MTKLVRVAVSAVMLLSLAFVGPASAKPTPYKPLGLAAAIRQDRADPVPAEFDVNKMGMPPDRLFIKSFPYKRLWEVCGRKVYACAYNINPGQWRILLDQNMSAAVRKIVLHHEYGHVLGWKHSSAD